MARKVKNGVAGPRLREPYRSAALSSGGMVHQIYRDAVIFDVWGRKLAVFRSGSTAGISWLSVRRWLKKHPEVGELAGTSWPATLESIVAWIRTRRELYEELDEEQRKGFEAAARVKNTRPE